MFCPNCKAKYRPGFTKCSDCGVDLVEHLPSENLDASGEVASDSEGRELLWSGRDPGFAESLRDALDRAELEHGDDTVELGFLPAFPGAVFKISVRTSDREAAREILEDVINGASAESSTTAARLAGDAANLNPYRGLNRPASKREPGYYNQASFPESPLSLNLNPGSRVTEDGASSEEQWELADSKTEDASTPNDIVEDFDAERATCEIWVGEDARMAQYFDDCLRGVGIGCVVSDASGKLRVLVMPESEKRAKEIVREVVEGAPPQ
jgi:hypothetical protein